ncbi:MAG: pyridoxamine 5'-phosphate oxidase family protein [Flavisolibacter sp.]
MEKNLQNDEARKKFKKLVTDIRTCMFITNSRGEHEHTRPMSTVEIDETGALWFFTDIRSIKVEEVSREHQVHLVYAHPGKESFLDVWGRATVHSEKQLIKDKWTPFVKAWFPNGIDDPNISLLRVQPDDVYYWNAEQGKMMSFFKIAIAAVTGKQMADDAQGALKV